jgi:hypothetical protein
VLTLYMHAGGSYMSLDVTHPMLWGSDQNERRRVRKRKKAAPVVTRHQLRRRPVGRGRFRCVGAPVAGMCSMITHLADFHDVTVLVSNVLYCTGNWDKS